MLTYTGCFCNASRNGTQAVPYGYAGGCYHSSTQVVFATWRAADCRPYIAWYRSTARVVFEMWHGDESSPLHCVIPFIHTGSIRNVGGTVSDNTRKRPPNFVIPTAAQAEWRNPLRWNMNQRKEKSATWEDPSTPFLSARDDMSRSGSIHPHRLYL